MSLDNEQIEVLRRIADRGLNHAQNCALGDEYPEIQDWDSQVDLWQHLLDELARLNKV